MGGEANGGPERSPRARRRRVRSAARQPDPGPIGGYAPTPSVGGLPIPDPSLRGTPLAPKLYQSRPASRSTLQAPGDLVPRTIAGRLAAPLPRGSARRGWQADARGRPPPSRRSPSRRDGADPAPHPIS